MNAAPRSGGSSVGAVPGSVVIFSSVRWNFVWQRHQSLAKSAAADGRTVVFVEPHPRGLRHVLSFLWRKLSSSAPPALENAVPLGVKVVAWRPIHVLTGRTRVIRRILGAGAPELVLIHLPSTSVLREANHLPGARLIYDNVLDWQAVPKSWFPPRGWKRVERVLEQRTREGSAALTTDSWATSRHWSDTGLKNTLIPPAVDDLFVEASWEDPPQRGPLGYFGTVREAEIDVDALRTLADAFQIEVVGDVERDARTILEAAGVSVRAAVPQSELIPIIERWSGVLMPYRSGPRTATLVPAKLWNAIATRRPVFVSGLEVPEELGRMMLPLTEDSVRAESGRLRHVEGPPTWAERWKDLLAAGTGRVEGSSSDAVMSEEHDTGSSSARRSRLYAEGVDLGG